MKTRALSRPVCVIAVACLASPLLCPGRVEAQAHRTVLTIHAGAESFPSNPILDSSVREALLSHVNAPIDYFAEYLKSDSFALEDASEALADYIRRKYLGRRIDLVIATTSQALKFVIDYRGGLFPGVPVVFSTVAVPEAISRSADRAFTGVTVGAAYAQTLRAAIHMHPSTERVFVVANGPDRDVVETVRAALRGVSSQVRLTYLDEPTVARLLEAVRLVPPRSVIFYIWQAQPEPGNLVYPDQVARLVAQAAPVPVYGTSDLYMGLGIVGGVMRRTFETGTRLGELGSLILNGARPADLPIEKARLVPTFDWRQIQRWGIDASLLPPGSDVQFRVPTVWEAYRAYAIGTLFVVTAQLLLIAALLTQRTRRQRAEQTLVAREATLRTSYEKIRQLAGQLINAQEAARGDLARDLHDGLCQRLAEVSMDIGRLKRSPAHHQDAHTQDTLSKIQGDTREMYEEIRRLSHELHPATLQLLGLAPALEAHCVEVARRHAVQVSFTADGDLAGVRPDVAVCLFRIAQESLRNGIVHGAARRLTVSLARTGGEVELTVTDDGRGFDLEAVRSGGRGLGLVSIEERAHAFGGHVHIATELEHGTTIRVRGLAVGRPDDIALD